MDANLKFVTVDVGAYDKQSNGGAFADACECGEEPSGSIKRGEFLDQLQTG